MTLQSDSKGNYRASRLPAIWMHAGARDAPRVRPRFWPRFKAGTLKNRLSWLFIPGTVLIAASVIRMWSHWFEISASLGSYRAGGILAAVTAAAVIVSWWLNTGNENE